MRTKVGPALVALFAVFAVALVGAGIVGFRAVQERVPEGGALAVGDRVVSVDELDRRTHSLRALYGVQPPVDDPARMDGFRRDSAKAYAMGIVLQRKAEEMGVSASDSNARKALDSYIEQQFGAGPSGREAFVQALGNVGASEREILDEIKQQLAVSALFAKVTRDVTVDDQELAAAFPKFRDRLGVPERRQISNIVVTNEEQAAQLAQDLGKGGDFAQAARRYSIDGSTRDKGGDLGTVDRTQLEGAYGEAAFAAKEDAVFGPVRTQHGWNVGKVERVVPGKEPVFEEVREQLRALAKLDEQLARWQDWVSQAIKDADVRYADEYRPADPDAVPTGIRPDGPGPNPPGGR